MIRFHRESGCVLRMREILIISLSLEGKTERECGYNRFSFANVLEQCSRNFISTTRDLFFQEIINSSIIQDELRFIPLENILANNNKKKSRESRSTS